MTIYSRFSTWIALGLSCALPSAVNADPWNGLETDRFELVVDDSEFHLREAFKLPIPIPREWLIPEAELAQAEDHYVAGFEYEKQVNSFPIGNGLTGLHLSSYEIQRSGSAQAADGRDIFLIFDPTGREIRLGLALPHSKGRVRLGGCFEAYNTRLLLGDVDCDRRLDLATQETRLDCEFDPDEGGPYKGYQRRGTLRWHLQTETGWSHDPSYDERLPCAGLTDLPLVGLARDPVQFVLERVHSQPLLFSRSVAVPAAGLSLSIPAEWRLDPEPNAVSEIRAYGHQAWLRVRVARNEEGVDLKTWLDGYLAFEGSLARTVKNTLRHVEIETETFRSSTGIEGYRTLFGWVPSDPALISYFLVNLEGDFVQIHLALSQDRTADIWPHHDRLLLGSLRLEPARR